MAVTFTFKSATDNQLKYLLKSTGAESGDLTAATMIADAVPGSKLAQLLGEAFADQAAAIAFLFGDLMKVSVLLGPQFATVKAWGITADVDTTAFKITANSEGADASVGSILTITHRHSAIR